MATNKVLVVDDELSIQKICSLYLQAEGFDVKALSEANHVVDEAASERPDVIVMDLNLPGVDGFAATQALKKARATAKIPIIIISARSDVEDKKLALVDCHADDYITKPFDPQELVARVTVLCRRKHESEDNKEAQEKAALHLETLQLPTLGNPVLPDTEDLLSQELIKSGFESKLKSIHDAAIQIARKMPGSVEIGTILTEIEDLLSELAKLTGEKTHRHRIH